LTQRCALLVAKHTSVTTAHRGTDRVDMSLGPRPRGLPLSLGKGTHLVQVLAVGAVAQEAPRAGAAGPGAVGEAAALSSREAGVGQAAVCREGGDGEARGRPGAAPSGGLRGACGRSVQATAGAWGPRGRGPRSHAAHPSAGHTHLTGTPTFWAHPPDGHPGWGGVPAHPPAGHTHPPGTPTCQVAPHPAHPRAGGLHTLHTHPLGTPTWQAHPPSGHTHLLGVLDGVECLHTHPPGTPTCRADPQPAHPPMGQLFLLHICCSLAPPTQSLPPCWGSGLLQTRVRSRIPPAQVTVQADHGDQGLHRPSTGGGRTARSCGDGSCTGSQVGL